MLASSFSNPAATYRRAMAALFTEAVPHHHPFLDFDLPLEDVALVPADLAPRGKDLSWVLPASTTSPPSSLLGKRASAAAVFDVGRLRRTAGLRENLELLEEWIMVWAEGKGDVSGRVGLGARLSAEVVDGESVSVPAENGGSGCEEIGDLDDGSGGDALEFGVTSIPRTVEGVVDASGNGLLGFADQQNDSQGVPENLRATPWNNDVVFPTQPTVSEDDHRSCESLQRYRAFSLKNDVYGKGD